MQEAARALVTEAEFLALPESSERVELLDGEVVVSPSPRFRHQEVLGRVLFALRDWARRSGTPATIGQSPLDVRFGASRILQPDAFVLLAPTPLDTVGPLTRIPELCVEVVSGDRLYDRVTKRLIYAAAGVREYWVVEPTTHGGLVERWTGEALGESEELRERLTTPLLVGFELELPALFAG